MATRVVLTYADYAALPSDGRRYELHEGEVSVTPAPSPSHQRVSRKLLVVLSAHVDAHRLGEIFHAPIDCILDDSTVVQPDLAYLAVDRLASVGGRGIEGPPSLVIEILSPSTVQGDRGVKRQLYARHAVPHYWIADPDRRTIEAYELAGGAYRPAGQLEGSGRAALPPFTDLLLDAATLWG